jgi:carboxyl-terminal processing protease
MMKRFVASGLLLFLLSGHYLRAQLPAIQQKAIVLKRMVELKHYAPKAVDDSFSAEAFDLLLEQADGRRLLFTKTEYQQLLAHRQLLDDELQGQGWKFLDLFSSLYQQALKRADSVVQQLLQKPFDYTVAESITRSRGAREFNFAADAAALKGRWSRYLKFVILNEVYDEVQEDSTKKTNLKTALTSHEPATRERVRKAQQKSLARILNPSQGFTALMTELYLNAIASCFDPHTNYFSPEGKEKLQEELSTEAYFFGIEFEENEKGQVVVDKLTPGGPAWKSGEINDGDELLSLHWEGKEAEDMSGATLEEVYEVLDRSLHDKLLFRFRKADGTVSMVFLRKEKSVNEENIVKSFILKGEKKIGYILLPGFYTEWENESGSSCANDVAKEILKLKRENIEGLILDVRYNGGGSLGEAMELTGIFIDEGPLAAEKDRTGKLRTLKDPNRGTIYDGPLTLMVNGQSASASEVLAATLQDYHRAVILGSPTFGKATGQVLFPLDTISSKLASGNPEKDMVKITVGKLFRMNGQTAQLQGVKPDVLLPDAFDGLEIGERYEQYPLPADTVKKNNYYKPLPYLPVAELAGRSTARVQADPVFRLIHSIAEEQKKSIQTVVRTIPLKAELFEKWMQEQEQALDIMKGETTPTNLFTIENHAADKQLLQADRYAKEINDTWLKNLADDIYIQEAYRVSADLINLLKTTKN